MDDYIVSIRIKDRLPGKPISPGSVAVPCSECGEEIYLSISGQRMLAAGAKPACTKCAAEHNPTETQMAPGVKEEIEGLVGRHFQTEEWEAISRELFRRVWGD